MQQAILLLNFSNLSEAVILSLEFEAAKIAIASRKDKIREVKFVEESDVPGHQNMTQKLDEMMKLLQSLHPEQKKELRARQARGGPFSCYNCGREGHISRNCRKSRSRSHERNRSPARSPVRTLVTCKCQEKLQFVDVRSRIKKGNDSLIVQGLNGQKCLITIDTGATRSVIRRGLVTSSRLIGAKPVLEAANGQKIPVHGEMTVTLGIGNMDIEVVAVVADIVDEFILGLDVMEGVGSISADFDNEILKLGNQEVFLKTF